MSYYTIFFSNDFDIKYELDNDSVIKKMETQPVFLHSTRLLNREELKDQSKLSKICEKFEKWDARFCKLVIRTEPVFHIYLFGDYIINPEDEYGFNTNTFLTKLISSCESKENYSKDTCFSVWQNSCELAFPRSYQDFQNHKLWVFGLQPPTSLELHLKDLVEKIISSKPVEIPCKVSYCYIEGVIDCFIGRTKTLALQKL